MLALDEYQAPDGPASDAALLLHSWKAAVTGRPLLSMQSSSLIGTLAVAFAESESAADESSVIWFVSPLPAARCPLPAAPSIAPRVQPERRHHTGAGTGTRCKSVRVSVAVA